MPKRTRVHFLTDRHVKDSPTCSVSPLQKHCDNRSLWSALNTPSLGEGTKGTQRGGGCRDGQVDYEYRQCRGRAEEWLRLQRQPAGSDGSSWWLNGRWGRRGGNNLPKKRWERCGVEGKNPPPKTKSTFTCAIYVLHRGAVSTRRNEEGKDEGWAPVLVCVCVFCLYITIAAQLQLIYVRNPRYTPSVPQRGKDTCHTARCVPRG